jgi:hypothetical protein
MATKPHIFTPNHAEWAAAVHAAFERDRERLAILAAEDRLTASQHRWWATPTERAEATAHNAQSRAWA